MKLISKRVTVNLKQGREASGNDNLGYVKIVTRQYLEPNSFGNIVPVLERHGAIVKVRGVANTTVLLRPDQYERIT